MIPLVLATVAATVVARGPVPDLLGTAAGPAAACRRPSGTGRAASVPVMGGTAAPGAHRHGMGPCAAPQRRVAVPVSAGRRAAAG